MSLIPGSGRSPGGGNGNPLQCSCVGNLMDRGAWWATVHGVAKSWTWLRDWVHKFEDMISEHLIGSELRHLDCPFKLSALKSKCLLQDTALKEHKGPPRASQVLPVVKILSPMQETRVQSLSQEDFLENGYPLQYSCLKSPMDRGAWQATVYGVAIVRHNRSDLAWMHERPPQCSWQKHRTCPGNPHIMWQVGRFW